MRDELSLLREGSDSTVVGLLKKIDINDGVQPDNSITPKTLNVQLKGHEKRNVGPQIKVHTDLQRLVNDHLRPALEKKTGCDRLTDIHPLFDSASRLMFKYGLSLVARLQFAELLCGILDLPVILLQIPKKYDCLKPPEEDRPLQWLEDCLQCHGLELRDVIVLDLLPIITDEWLGKSNEKTREECIKEVCNFVVHVLQTIKPSIVISCQSLADTCWNQHDRWGALTDSVIMDLCSSLSCAEKQQVSKVCLGEQSVHVVQGFHPTVIWNKEGDDRVKTERILADIIREVYQPCGEWKNREQEKIRPRFTNSAEDVFAAASNLLKAMEQHIKVKSAARALGIYWREQERLYPKGGRWASVGDIYSDVSDCFDDESE